MCAFDTKHGIVTSLVGYELSEFPRYLVGELVHDSAARATHSSAYSVRSCRQLHCATRMPIHRHHKTTIYCLTRLRAVFRAFAVNSFSIFSPRISH